MDSMLHTLTAEIHSAFSSVLNCRHSLRTLGVMQSAPYAGDGTIVMAAAASAIAASIAVQSGRIDEEATEGSAGG